MVFRAMWREILDLYRFRWLVITSVRATLKLRYRRSALGFFWSLLGPTLNYGTLAFVFYYGLKPTSGSYLLFVLPGILAFGYIANALPNSSSAFIANEMYIKKIFVPKSVFVLNSVISDFVNFFLACVSLGAVGFFFGVLNLSISMILLPLFFILFFVFVLGVGLILSIFTVFFRDVQHMLPILIQALFYLTPILYNPDMLPDFLRPIQTYNPIYVFVRIFRSIVSGFSIVPSEDLAGLFLIATGLSMITLFLGFLLLKTFDNRIVFRL